MAFALYQASAALPVTGFLVPTPLARMAGRYCRRAESPGPRPARVSPIHLCSEPLSLAAVNDWLLPRSFPFSAVSKLRPVSRPRQCFGRPSRKEAADGSTWAFQRFGAPSLLEVFSRR